jgi:16S rRNA (guanine966-N2)-methyltransferase
MRIVSGTYRGRALVAPKGHSTRPTADRTRQALFNVLEHAPWSHGLRGLRVLDLFAGSGALGLEALSRGAIFCVGIDLDEDARAAIERNAKALGAAGDIAVRRADATRLGPRADPAPFDLVFLDPPYGTGMNEPALAALGRHGWLAPGAIVVVERGTSEAPLIATGYERLDSRDWGAARVYFLRPISTTSE